VSVAFLQIGVQCRKRFTWNRTGQGERSTCISSKQKLCSKNIAKEPKSSQIAKQKFWSKVLLKRAKCLGFASKIANVTALAVT